MKWSQFIYIVDSEKNKILFNTLNKAVVSLPYEEYEEINMFLNDEVTLNFKYEDDYQQIVEMGFIIEDDLFDKDIILNQISNYNSLSKKLDVTILTTTNCNFKCAYCYENGIDRHFSLKEQDSVEIVNYLEIYFKKHKLEKLNLCFFGGEPTLNWNFIQAILPKLNNKCNEYGIILEVELITNGYLLTDSKVDFLCNYNLNAIQITLDGTKTIHDRRRMLKNESGTFDTIIKNMTYILNKKNIKVKLRINYDSGNANDTYELLNYLQSKFSGNLDNIHFSFGAIEDTKYNNTENNTKIYLNNHEIEKYYVDFYKVCKDNNLNIDDFFELGSLCMAKRNNSIIISSDKKLYKCLSMVGKSAGIEGDLTSDIDNISNYLYLDLYNSCFEKKCEFIPMCHTGCRFTSYINNNSLHNHCCNYDMMANINKEILKVLNE